MEKLNYDIIIIGTGLAAYQTVKELRKLGGDSRILMIGQGEGGFYSKPLLSTSLAAGKTPQELWVSDVASMEATLDITVWANTLVNAIDLDTKSIHCADGRLASFSRLVLAVGAEPNQLDIPGFEHAVVVNQLEEYAAFRERLSQVKSVTILGAGLVASEYANDLILSGYQVHCIAPDAWPLQSLVPKEAGEALKKALMKEGVHYHLEETPCAIEKQGEQFCVKTNKKESITCDLVLSATGIHPLLDLAKAAGLEVSKGIKVNQHLQTSHPEVYALGDCAEIVDKVMLYIAPIMHSAKVLASQLYGDQSAKVDFPVMPIVAKTSVCPVSIIGPREENSHWNWSHERELDNGLVMIARDANHQVKRLVLTGSAIKLRQTLLNQYF